MSSQQETNAKKRPSTPSDSNEPKRIRSVDSKQAKPQSKANKPKGSQRSSKRSPQQGSQRSPQSEEDRKEPQAMLEEEVEQCEPAFVPSEDAIVSAFIPNPQQLNNILRVGKSVLTLCPWTFVPPDMTPHDGAPSEEDVEQLVAHAPGPEQFSGIALHCASHSLTCIVVARFKCIVTVAPGASREDMCAVVDMTKLAAMIASRGADESLEIYRRRDEACLRIKSGKSTSGHITNLSTLDSDPTKTCFALRSMAVEFTVEIDTEQLVKMTKLAGYDGADWVSIHLWQAGPIIYLVFKTKGDTSGNELAYKSVAARQLNSNVTCFSMSDALVGPPNRLGVDKGACVQRFWETYGVAQLRTFVTAAPTRTVLMRFTSGKPLILTSLFGDTQGNIGPSFVSQVQAPQIKSDGDDSMCDFFS